MGEFNNLIPVICVSGPTASGKSNFAIQLAKVVGGEIVNADSVQVYCGFDVGSGKIKTAEMEGIEHHLLSHVDPREQYSAGRFKREAMLAIEEISAKGKIPIIVGGTGLYVRALFSEFLGALNTASALKMLENVQSNFGEEDFLKWCWSYLCLVDPEAANRIGQNDSFRIQRALLLFLSIGIPQSLCLKAFNKKDSRICGLVFVLEEESSSLYSKINERVLGMFENGLVSEVAEIAAENKEAPGLRSLGYRHIFSSLNQPKALEMLEISSLINNIQRDTRRFAKRQKTWWRNQPSALGWVPVSEFIETGDAFAANDLENIKIVELRKEKAIAGTVPNILSYLNEVVFRFRESVRLGNEKEFCLIRCLDELPVFYERIALNAHPSI